MLFEPGALDIWVPGPYGPSASHRFLQECGEGLNCPSHSTLSGLVSGTSQRGEQLLDFWRQEAKVFDT